MDYSKYKILYLDSTNIVKNDILWGLIELGFQVERGNFKVHLTDFSEEEVTKIAAILDNYHYVVSQNFSVNIAEACFIKNRMYISWVYDSPQVSLYGKRACYPTNYIFAFDRKQVERIRANSCDRIFHQPLAANMLQAGMVNITDEDIAKYSSEVSFVGGIYNVPYYRKFISQASDEVKDNLDEMYRNIACNWKKGVTPINYLNETASKYLESHVDTKGLDEYNMSVQYLGETALIIPELAGYERIKVLNAMGDLFDTNFYTNSSSEVCSAITNVKIHPPVNSESDAYKVYYSSKVNLNISLRTIETGVPQRVFDIMSVGGAVFSNYQEEIEELFVIDKDIVIFHTLDELKDKVRYYLAHEQERVKIGINGYYRVRDEYNYPMVLKRMFEKVEKDS